MRAKLAAAVASRGICRVAQSSFRPLAVAASRSTQRLAFGGPGPGHLRCHVAYWKCTIAAGHCSKGDLLKARAGWPYFPLRSLSPFLPLPVPARANAPNCGEAKERSCTFNATTRDELDEQQEAGKPNTSADKLRPSRIAFGVSCSQRSTGERGRTRLQTDSSARRLVLTE